MNLDAAAEVVAAASTPSMKLGAEYFIAQRTHQMHGFARRLAAVGDKLDRLSAFGTGNEFRQPKIGPARVAAGTEGRSRFAALRARHPGLPPLRLDWGGLLATRDRLGAAPQLRIESFGDLASEFRILTPDGHSRLRAPIGGILGQTVNGFVEHLGGDAVFGQQVLQQESLRQVPRGVDDDEFSRHRSDMVATPRRFPYTTAP